MADFAKALEKTLIAEGGYILHNVAGDTGGQTFAGIARNKNPQWPGWACIDKNDMAGARAAVAAFYRSDFWKPIRGDEIINQQAAESLFDFAVNTGPGTAVKLAQGVLGVTADGAFGPKSIAALNAAGEVFPLSYALAKIRRYSDICNKNRDQSKFLLGWVNRTFNQLKG